jgi:hypothetical protein
MMRTLYIYVSKDVKIRGYFSKPKGFRQRKCWGNAAQFGLRELENRKCPNALRPYANLLLSTEIA